jgi:predicted amidohydrolase YtcJ
MSSEILAIEDWELPGRTVRAVKDKQDFMERLASAEAALSSPDEPLLTWGYHPDFFGPLTGSELDEISANRPIIVWARSCHEMTLNRAAMKRGGVTQEVHNSFAPSAKAQSNF